MRPRITNRISEVPWLLLQTSGMQNAKRSSLCFAFRILLGNLASKLKLKFLATPDIKKPLNKKSRNNIYRRLMAKRSKRCTRILYVRRDDGD